MTTKTERVLTWVAYAVLAGIALALRLALYGW